MVESQSRLRDLSVHVGLLSAYMVVAASGIERVCARHRPGNDDWHPDGVEPHLLWPDVSHSGVGASYSGLGLDSARDHPTAGPGVADHRPDVSRGVLVT